MHLILALSKLAKSTTAAATTTTTTTTYGNKRDTITGYYQIVVNQYHVIGSTYVSSVNQSTPPHTAW